MSPSHIRALARPLGNWLHDPFRYHRWFFDEDSSRLFRRERMFYIAYTSRRNSGSLFLSTDLTSDLPPTAVPASVTNYRSQRSVVYLNHSDHTIPAEPAPLPPAESLYVAKYRLHHADQWAVEELSCPDNGEDIARAIIQGIAAAICDGSYKSMYGTSSFTVVGISVLKRALGRNRIPGSPSQQKAYRSELGGVAGIVVFLSMLCSVHNIQHGHITVALDGERAKDIVSQDWDPSPSRTNFDLIHNIREKIKRLPMD